MVGQLLAMVKTSVSFGICNRFYCCMVDLERVNRMTATQLKKAVDNLASKGELGKCSECGGKIPLPGIICEDCYTQGLEDKLDDAHSEGITAGSANHCEEIGYRQALRDVLGAIEEEQILEGTGRDSYFAWPSEDLREWIKARLGEV